MGKLKQLALQVNNYNIDEHMAFLAIHDIAPYTTRKASVGIYHVCDYPYYSCLDTFWHCHPYFTLQFYANVFYTCIIERKNVTLVSMAVA